MSTNHKQSSSEVAELAAKVLKRKMASAVAKQLAGSVLAQFSSKKQTGEVMEAVASSVLRSSRYSAETKKLAASVLSQSSKGRKA